MTERRDDELLKAAATAAAVLGAFYEWLDRVEAAGGATSLGGIAACDAMLKSLRKQKPRVDSLVIQPLRAALDSRE